MIYDCIIVGAGASGLFAGARFDTAAGGRPAGLILEKTGRAGTKLLMSGGGRCNITHAGSIKDFIDRYGKKGGRIRSCLYKHNNLELIGFLEENGISTVTQEEDERVFPASGKAQDIRDFLVRKSRENGFEIAYNQEVTGIRRIPAEEAGVSQSHSSHSAPACWELTANKTTFRAKTIILASGGCSYPATGSDGQLFSVLQRDLDLKVTTLRPALTSIRVQSYPYTELTGIAFADCRITLLREHKKIAEENGGLLFTHRDFSGPAILNISNYAQPGDTLVIDYLKIPQDAAASKLQKSVEKSSGELPAVLAKTFELPKKFSRLLAAHIGSSTKSLAAALTGDKFQITSLSGFEKAMTTAGGIDLMQIDLKTMELKEHSGIFVCGEMIDIDGSTGGYNLQFAYSSGCTAAESAIKLL